MLVLDALRKGGTIHSFAESSQISARPLHSADFTSSLFELGCNNDDLEHATKVFPIPGFHELYRS